jgi:hypothetical protein
MTSLEKPVTRRTRAQFQHYGKNLVVTLEPGDVIAIRLERTRTTLRAPLNSVYIQLCQWNAEAQRREKTRKRSKRSA